MEQVECYCWPLYSEGLTPTIWIHHPVERLLSPDCDRHSYQYGDVRIRSVKAFDLDLVSATENKGSIDSLHLLFYSLDTKRGFQQCDISRIKLNVTDRRKIK